jgi:nucleotide-binding universal stress UspA family protein
MSFKTLLTHAQPGDASDRRLDAAAALARSLDALLIGLGAEAVPPYALSDPYGVAVSDLAPLLYDQQTRDLDAARKGFETHAAGARTAWRSCRGIPTDALAREACAADLIVAGGGPINAGDIYYAANLGELIVKAGKPVLVVPPEGGHLNPRRILIAWKNTREARRAVADALPFLVKAEEILILAVCEKEESEISDFEVKEVADMLVRHGAPAPRTHVVHPPATAAESDILVHADQLDADLIVAGGYGHSRASEWVLGGVTRTLLRNCKRFLLLSH